MSEDFSSRRRHSGPDSRKNETRINIDRPRSGNPDVGNKFSSGRNNQFSSRENGGLNRARVNQWMESEVKSDKDLNAPPRKPFYHYPGNSGANQGYSAKVIGKESFCDRPQTETGRSRVPFFPENIEGRARQSVHEAGTSPVSSSDGSSEDWVVVKKSSSGTTTHCKPKADSSVLVPNPNQITAPLREQSSDDTERTRMVLSNKFGSAFEILPQIPERNRGTEGQAGDQRNDNSETPGKRNVTSVPKIGNIAKSLLKWKGYIATAEARSRIGFRSLDKEQQEILVMESDKIKTEIPEALMRTIKEEAYKIVLKTTRAYRSQVGAKHKLTRQAFEYAAELKEELKKT